MKIVIVSLSLMLALIAGLAAAIFSWGALALVGALVLALCVLLDYRIGVVFVALFLPFISSPLLPQIGGFNPISYSLAGSMLVLVVGRVFKLRELIFPPRVLLLCLVSPLCVGALVALPHLAEGVRNFPGGTLSESAYMPTNYIKEFLIRPLMYVIFSVLLANALRDSEQPERFIVLLALATMIPVTAIVSMVAFLGIDLSYLQSHRGFLSGLGLHANEFGKLLAFVFGPLLYVSFASKGPRQLFFGLATVALLCGILLTFTRAAYVAVAIVTAIFLIQRRRPGLVIAMTIGISVLALVAPSAIIDRITTGVDERSIASAKAGSLNDELTAGRIGGFQLLLPEVIRSPLWGRGTGATAWSAPVTSGRYAANHPHNLYLESALDVGLVGLGLSIYLYYRLLDGMRRLARNPALSSEMQAFFGGSAAAFIGILVLSFAGGNWYPHPEQALMWVAFGVTFAYWPWVEADRLRERKIAAEHPETATPSKRKASPAPWS